MATLRVFTCRARLSQRCDDVVLMGVNRLILASVDLENTERSPEMDEIRMASLNEIRQRVADNPQCRIVSAAEFSTMIVSRSAFSRADEPGANMLGLLDEATGCRVFVKEEEMQPSRRMPSQLN